MIAMWVPFIVAMLSLFCLFFDLYLDPNLHLLLDKDSNLRLTGFGVGRFEGSTTTPKFDSHSSGFPTNVRWLAPEVLKDEFYSKHSDVW